MALLCASLSQRAAKNRGKVFAVISGGGAYTAPAPILIYDSIA